MKFKALILSCLAVCTTYSCPAIFVPTRGDLAQYNGNSEYVMVASTGRSGSTMLTDRLCKYLPEQYVLKSHLLPPSKAYKGKILFVFSSPDQTAESTLYMALHVKNFGVHHFANVETSSIAWRRNPSMITNPDAKHNLFTFDALGLERHLQVWLHTGVVPASVDEAQILALKYENLWDEETVEAIRSFLKIPEFTLPEWRPRGHQDLTEKEIELRKAHNVGTEEEPIYRAYDKARALWEQAPAFEFFKIK
ncbi:MAG: hypothetical protein JSR46_00670 [Verrucomicrobia bacterium]|nr:hypothetical protein [Verrucomicrobiota bacterium]